jgi:ankyrin repeat protein
VECKDVKGMTPLAVAVQYGHTSIASALMSEFGFDPNDGVSLHTACRRGNLSVVKILIDHGANVECKDVEGMTPLAVAVKCDHTSIYTSIVSALVSEFGCDPNDGVSLHTACRCGSLSMVKILLDHGADVECKDVNGDTPLHCAIRARNPKTVSALVQDYKFM